MKFNFSCICKNDILNLYLKHIVKGKQGEYDAYVKFCELAGYQCLTVDECKSFYKRKTTSDLAESIRTIKNYRYNVSTNNYEAMIVAFCYLCLLGDKAMDENEYYIIRCFFDESEDYCPSDWATFKREC